MVLGGSRSPCLQGTLRPVFVTGVNERAIKTNLGQATHQPLGRTHKLVRDTLSTMLCVGNIPPLPAAYEGPSAPCASSTATSTSRSSRRSWLMAREIHKEVPMRMHTC